MGAVKIGTLADLPEEGGRAFEVSGHMIAVFQVEGELFAIDDTCTHDDASLSEGELDPDMLCVECPHHGALFSLRTGEARTLPAYKPVKTYRVYTEGVDLFVEYIT